MSARSRDDGQGLTLVYCLGPLNGQKWPRLLTNEGRKEGRKIIMMGDVIAAVSD